MPNWIHRTTKQVLKSVAAADLIEPAGAYIEEPDLAAVAGQPTKYWVISGDVVSLVDGTTQAAIDAAEQADAEVAELSAVGAALDAAEVLTGRSLSGRERAAAEGTLLAARRV